MGREYRPRRENTQGGKLIERGRIAVIATDGFEEAELLEPQRKLDDEGAEAVVVGLKVGKIQGRKHDQKGGSVKGDVILDEVTAEQFDSLRLPGGVANADAIRMDPKVQRFVRATDMAHKSIAAICHAPWILVSSLA